MKNIVKKNTPQFSEDGFSILEIVASILIVSIILMAIIPLFFTSAKTIEKSDEILNATYYTQNHMEEIYHLTKSTTYIEGIAALGSGGWNSKADSSGMKHFQKNVDEYVIDLYISRPASANSLITVLITSSLIEKPEVIESQMETIIEWKN